MKKKCKVLVSVAASLLLLLNSVGAAMFFSAADENESSNLIKNPGFEDGMAEWGSYEHYEIITDGVHGGSKAVKLTGQGGQWFGPEQVVDVEPNSLYTLSFYARTDGDAVTTVKILDPADGETAITDQVNVLATADWTTYTVVIRTGEHRQIMLRLMNHYTDGQAVYYDDFRLTASSELINGSFETGDMNSWTRYDYASVVDSEHQEGAYALKLDGSGGRYGGTRQYVSVEKNTDYKVSFYYKGAGIGTVKLEDANEQPIREGFQFNTHETTDWVLYETTIHTGENSVMGIYIMNMAEGVDVYYDAFRVEKVQTEPVPEEGNLILNGGFEYGAAAWSEYANGQATTEDKHSGEYSMKLSGEGGNYGGPAQEIAVEKNTAYTLSFYAKSTGNTSVKIVGKTGDKSAQITQIDIGASDWGAYTTTINSGEYDVIRVEMMQHPGDATIYYDDFWMSGPYDELVNGGFDTGDMDGWTPYDYASVVDSEHQAGTHALKLDGSGGQYNGTRQLLAVERNTDYKVSFYYKGEGDGTVKLENEKGEPIQEGFQFNPHKQADWYLYEATINTGDNAFMSLFIMNMAQGVDAYYDSFQVEKVQTEPVPEEGNLILNGGFEYGNAAWSEYANGQATTEDKHSGEYSMKLSGEGGAWGGPEQTVTVEKNTAYALSFYAKAPEGGVTVKILGSDSASIKEEYVAGENWGAHTLIFNSGENEAIRIQLMRHENGTTAYLDDFRMTAPNAELENGGFDTGDMTGWTPYDYASAVDSEHQAGTHALKLDGSGGGNNGTRQLLAVEKNTDYKVSFYYKGAGIGTVKLENENGVQIQEGFQFNAHAQEDWYLYDATINTGDNAFMSLFIMNMAEGVDVYYDSFQVEKVQAEPEPEPEEGNLILNGSFEYGNAAWGEYEFIEIVESGAHSGDKAMMLTGEDRPWSGPEQTVQVKKNTTYTLSFYAKTDGVGLGTVKVLDIAGNQSLTNQFDIQASTEWQPYTRTFNTGENEVLTIQLMNMYPYEDSGSHSAYYDTFVLAEEAAQPEPEPEPEPEPGNLILNPGFELDKAGWSDYEFSEIITENVHGGSKAAKLTGLGGQWGGLEQIVDVEPHSTYNLSFYARTDGDAVTTVKILDPADGETPITNQIDVRASAEWTLYTATIETGEHEQIMLRLMNHYDDGQAVYYDDFLLAKPSGELVNGDFETGDATGWGAYEYCEVTTEEKHGGEYAMKLLGTGGRWNGPSQTIAVDKNAKYTLSFYAKTEGFSTVKILDLKGEPVADQFNVVAGEGDWTLYTAMFNVGDNTAINIMMMNHYTTEDEEYFPAYFDDFTFVREPDDPELPPLEGDNLVANPGFEYGAAGWSGASTVAGSRFAVTTDMPHNGEYSLKLTGIGGFGGVRQTITLEPNTDYVLSFYARVIDGNHGSNVVKVITQDESKDLSTQQLPTGGLEWFYYETEFNSGDNTTAVLFIGDGGAPEAYYDDFSIVDKSKIEEVPNLILTDEDTGIRVEFQKLSNTDAYTGVASMQIEQSAVSDGVKEAVADYYMEPITSVYTISFYDEAGNAVTDFGGRSIQVTIPLTPDQQDISVYLAQVLGDTAKFLTIDYVEDTIVCTFPGDTPTLTFLLASMVFEEWEPTDPTVPGGNEPGGTEDTEDPIPPTGVVWPAGALGLTIISGAALYMARTRKFHEKKRKDEIG